MADCGSPRTLPEGAVFQFTLRAQNTAVVQSFIPEA